MHCIANWTSTAAPSALPSSAEQGTSVAQVGVEEGADVEQTLVPCNFDIISFNFGIHDTSHNQEHLTLPVYIETLTVSPGVARLSTACSCSRVSMLACACACACACTGVWVSACNAADQHSFSCE